MEPSDNVSFRRVVKKQAFHTLKQTIQYQKQHCNISLQALYTVVKWLEHALDVREVSSSIPDRGTKISAVAENLLAVSFHMSVKRKRFHTLKTHDTKLRTTQNSFHVYMLKLDLDPFPIDYSFTPKWAKTYHFLFIPTFSCFPLLLNPQRPDLWEQSTGDTTS